MRLPIRRDFFDDKELSVVVVVQAKGNVRPGLGSAPEAGASGCKQAVTIDEIYCLQGKQAFHSLLLL